MAHDITDIVIRLTNKRVKELAEQMRDEMKAVIADGGHIRTGKAYNSIEVHYNNATSGSTGFGLGGASGSMRGGFLTSVQIGSYEASAYYLDQGNGGKTAVIRSTREFDRRGRRPGKLKLRDGSYATYVMGYDGIHFAREVANRHR